MFVQLSTEHSSQIVLGPYLLDSLTIESQLLLLHLGLPLTLCTRPRKFYLKSNQYKSTSMIVVYVDLNIIQKTLNPDLVRSNLYT